MALLEEVIKDLRTVEPVKRAASDFISSAGKAISGAISTVKNFVFGTSKKVESVKQTAKHSTSEQINRARSKSKRAGSTAKHGSSKVSDKADQKVKDLGKVAKTALDTITNTLSVTLPGAANLVKAAGTELINKATGQTSSLLDYFDNLDWIPNFIALSEKAYELSLRLGKEVGERLAQVYLEVMGVKHGMAG